MQLAIILQPTSCAALTARKFLWDRVRLGLGRLAAAGRTEADLEMEWGQH